MKQSLLRRLGIFVAQGHEVKDQRMANAVVAPGAPKLRTVLLRFCAEML